MITRIVRMSKMSYLNIQNRSQCSIGCALEVHLTQKKIGKNPPSSLFLGINGLNTCQMPQTAR